MRRSSPRSRRSAAARSALPVPSAASASAITAVYSAARAAAITVASEHGGESGLISPPGAMTGLILAGVSPLTAIRYQIVVMSMLLAAAALAALTAARLAERALFDDA